MYLTDAVPAECLNTAQNNEGERTLEEKLRHARDHEEEIHLLMEFRRQAPYKANRTKENF